MSGQAERPQEVPTEVAYQATSPAAAGPEPSPGSGAERILLDGCCLLVTQMPTVSFVEDVRVEASDVASLRQEVHAALRARGRRQAAWVVPRTSAQLLAALGALGLEPYTESPLEPEYAAMALLRPPSGRSSPDVAVRAAVELDEYLAAGELAIRTFGISGADAEGLLRAMRRRHEETLDGTTPMRTYLAYLDGRLVGEAQAAEMAAGSNLSGGSVLPQARGRGVYRALVLARWEDAVARGRPALTVQAGAMSRPVLERLGFRTVATQALLRDLVG